jgi:leucine-rich repeat kinase 2
LTNLKYLDLSYQSIKQIPDEIENLKHLERLILKSCIFLESISPKLANLNLSQIDLFNCSSLKTPPREICRRGTFSIMGYLRRLNSGFVQCKRTKLMLVGLGEAGKTSLLNALMKKKQNQERPTLTDGIDIKEWSIKLKDNSDLVFSMWDFGMYI